MFENLGQLIRKRFPYCERFTFAIFFGVVFFFPLLFFLMMCQYVYSCAVCLMTRGEEVFLFHVIKCHLSEVHGRKGVSKEICQRSGKHWVQQARLEQLSGISALLSSPWQVGWDQCQSQTGCVYAQDSVHNPLSLLECGACSEQHSVRVPGAPEL